MLWALWFLPGLLLVVGQASGQVMPPAGVRMDSQGRPMGAARQMQGGDSLQQRDSNEDSITIYYRDFDSSRVKFIDSSLNDFSIRYPVPAHHLFLNQQGGASRSVYFVPNMQPGFDAGLKGYDAYHFNLANTRFFNTTRPYTELDYLLAGKAEQTIKILHTQNLRPLWNASFEYRLFNSPGHFKNSSANHSSTRFASDFITENRRYSGVFVFYRNRSKVNENGGIQGDSFITRPTAAYLERFNIPTFLGGDDRFSNNFFASQLNTGNDYQNRTLYFRHQYDLGQQDSVLTTDSTYQYRFFPRLRLQHTLMWRSSSFMYVDRLADTDEEIKEVYRQVFRLPDVDSPFILRDQWRDFTNEGAVIFFPEKNNQEQFLKLGAGLQLLNGTFDSALFSRNDRLNSFYTLGEYRNRTRNRKWEINANGKFFVTGPYAGDFSAAGFISSNLGPKLGLIRIGFQNTLRSPSFIFDDRSAFIRQNNLDLNKENITTFSADLYVNRLNLALKGRYHLLSNYTFWTNFAVARQDGTLQNVLHLSADKKTKLSRRWSWYAELHVQQSSSSGINVPLVYTRNRIAYEGVFYKNLNLSTGIEFRYFSPFTADTWSPFNGQWVAQSQTTLRNLPDIAAFLHFRIRSFRAFFRAENLNTFDPANGFGWTNNNFAAPLYANPGLNIRIGIYWSFVN